MFGPTTTSADVALELLRSRPAIYRQVEVAERPWPGLYLGTGGLAIEAVVHRSFGYKTFQVVQAISPVQEAPFAKLMQEVKFGFGRTMSRLPAIFGVSRQTLYNWLDGETPKDIHQERLRQLALAAKVFSELGVKPTALMLDRVILQGKSFLQLMAEGADGVDTARKLVRISQRGNDARAKLDAMLVGRKAKIEAADLGSAALDEDV